LSATCAAWVTRSPISAIEADSSSAAEATVCTFSEASWQALATTRERSEALPAVCDMLCAASRMSPASAMTSPTTACTLASNLPANSIMVRRFSLSACCFISVCSACILAIAAALSLNTPSDFASPPISSLRAV
jgi:hypothetical protein